MFAKCKFGAAVLRQVILEWTFDNAGIFFFLVDISCHDDGPVYVREVRSED